MPKTTSETERKPRAILVVLDSVGVGHAPDAAKFFNDETPDTGANTLGHIRTACEAGACEGRRYGESISASGPLSLPNLSKLGIWDAAAIAAGQSPKSTDRSANSLATAMTEVSVGKDTTTGHLEICGLELESTWGLFPKTAPSFPEGLIQTWIENCKLPGVLGLRHASGTQILDEFGEQHIATGKPIVYTSADSVFQVIANEDHFGLDRLYDICAEARNLCDPLNIGRVIARPFVGETKGQFVRTGNRKDFAMPPPGTTLLDACQQAGVLVHCVGKVADIFAHQGVSASTKASGLKDLFDTTLAAMERTPESALIFTNFVDFDTEFGHRRDVPGYAAALEYFDRRLPELLEQLQPNDLLLITADHGNDPTWVGSDHTRERVPLLLYGPNVEQANAPLRNSFADAGQTLAKHLDIAPLAFGQSIL